MAGNDIGLEDVEFDDLLIYWRALIIKLQSQTYFKQLINLIKWFPYGHREGFKQDVTVSCIFLVFNTTDYIEAALSFGAL